jgi:two-component system, sensor histidine kinase
VKEALRILLVEDNSAQADLAQRAIREGGIQAHVEHVPRIAAALGCLARAPFDVVLLDLNLPDSRGIATVARLRAAAPDVPIIILTSLEGEPGGVAALQAGAQDYLPKDRVDGEVLSRVIRYALERHRYQLERAAALDKQRELERLREMDRLKSNFFDAASHELNTPLTPLKMQVDLLLSEALGPLNDRQRQAVRLLHRSVDRLARLVEEMLDVNRVQRGRLRLHKQPIDLDRIVAEAAELFREPLRMQRVALDVQLGGPLHVEADARRIGQVLINLLSNALKFTPPDGRIEIHTEAVDREAHLHVQDTGIGFTPDQHSRLFLPFSQVHSGEAAVHGGSGLGLYIARGILEQHGGRVWAHSPGPGRGATFSLALPLRAAVMRSAGNGAAPMQAMGPVGHN